MFAAVLEPGGDAEAGGGRNLKTLEKAIAEGQQKGEVCPGHPVLMARGVWALFHGASLLRLDRDSAEPPFMRFCTEALRAGLDQPADASRFRKASIQGLNPRNAPEPKTPIENKSAKVVIPH